MTAIRDYAHTAWRWKWLVALIAVTCAVTALVVSIQLPKAYKTSAVGLVSPKQLIPPAGTSSDSAPQVPSLDQLVETYVGLINTDPVRQQLVKDGIPRSAGELQANISAFRQPNTTLISITVGDRDPAVTELIAKDIIPAFNHSLDELQGKVGADPKNHLESLVPWEIPTTPPGSPVSPDIPRNVGAALLAGLIGGLAIAFVIEALDNTVKAESDVHIKLHTNLLGSVLLRRPTDSGDQPGQKVEVISASHPTDPLAEQYRALRTNLMFSRVDQSMRSLLVTSTAPAEGKTTTACNLAVVMAQAGNRVILVDADFRRPALHQVFRFRNDAGLGHLILRERPVAELVRATGIPNLRVISTGPAPPNPSELLGSSAMSQLMDRLADEADIIVFDTPPVGAVTDATVLGALVDGVVVVVEQGKTGITSIIRGLQTLQAVDANVLGIVLNKAPRGEDAAYYDYYYGHSANVAAIGGSPQPRASAMLSSPEQRSAAAGGENPG